MLCSLCLEGFLLPCNNKGLDYIPARVLHKWNRHAYKNDGGPVLWLHWVLWNLAIAKHRVDDAIFTMGRTHNFSSRSSDTGSMLACEFANHKLWHNVLFFMANRPVGFLGHSNPQRIYDGAGGTNRQIRILRRQATGPVFPQLLHRLTSIATERNCCQMWNGEMLQIDLPAFPVWVVFKGNGEFQQSVVSRTVYCFPQELIWLDELTTVLGCCVV